MSLRKILSKNQITYKLYLLYRVYFKDKNFKKKNYYGQWKEDLDIVEFFDRKNIKNGNYLDIGCFDPFKYSNTCLLYQNGWTGINIDLNQTSIDIFNLIRKKDINICSCISDKKKQVEIYFDSPFSSINSSNKKFFENFVKNDPFKNAFKNYTKIYTKTKTINEILEKDKNNIITKIHYLNIDVEGSDYEVLKSINLKKFDIDLISIELHTLENKKSENFENINNYLDDFNYKFYKKIGLTSLYHS